MEETGVPIKVIIDYKSLKYFITIKKITRRHCWAEFLSRFNYIIFYTSSKENQKADLLTRRPNNLLSSKNNEFQQYQLQTLFSTKRLEISSITKRENTIIIKQLIKTNLEDEYCFKLRHSLETGHLLTEIDSHHFSHLSADSKNCIY